MWLSVLIAVLTAYLLGNLNGAVCVSALYAHDDVRNHGSGNAGLTNFIRNYGGGQSAFVIAIDGGKAVLACLCAGLLLAPYDLYLEGTALGGLCVMLGHDFPALLGFKGGKGILSGLMIAFCVDWRVAVVILAVFALTYVISGYVSLSSILASTAFAVCFAVWHYDSVFVMVCGIVMGALCVFMHRGNIVRLCKGQEQKTNLFKRGDKQ